MRSQSIHRGPLCRALLLAGLASLSGHASAQANLVANGGFETGSFASWSEVGNSAFNNAQCPGAGLVPQGICSGTFGPLGSLGGIQQAITTTPGLAYTISFDYKGDGGAPGQVLVEFGSQTLLNRSDAAAATVGFQSFAFEAVATGASTLLSFNFRNDSGFMELDNVAVTAVPEPASLALMLAGIGTLLGAGRLGRHRI